MLRIVNMCKKFSSQLALENINLEVKKGEFFSLLGPSGCGKTTLLRIIAGFEESTSGNFFWNDQPLIGILPQSRPFNMVFQRYGLFPHMTVYENVSFGLEMKKVSRSSIQKRVLNCLDMVGLVDFKNRYPETLSGGQAQRVAVARAIVNEPQILLLDEPLSALDIKMREHMQFELRSLQRRLGITFILVTHDQDEAFALSDRIAVMNKAKIEQVSTPEELFENPQSHFVADFIGGMGSLRGVGDSSIGAGQASMTLAPGVKIKGRGNVHGGVPADAFVRPDSVKFEKSDSDDNSLTLQVSQSAFKGRYYELLLSTGDAHQPKYLRAHVSDLSRSNNFSPGKSVTCYFSPKDTFLFARPEM